MFNRAVQWGYLKRNPLEALKSLKEPPGRLRYLGLQDLARLLAICAQNGYLLPVVQLALHGGLRRGEILSLKWQNIDLSRRIIILEKTKTNEQRIIPLNDTLLRVLENLPRKDDSDFVFAQLSGNMISVAFKKACKKAGISNFRFHDLRHTFASYLSMAGFNQRTIQDLLGHRDPRMSSRYTHLSHNYLSQAVKALDNTFSNFPLLESS